MFGKDREKILDLNKEMANLVPDNYAPPKHRGAQVAKLTCDAIRHEFQGIINRIHDKLTELDNLLEDRKKHAEIVIEKLKEIGENQATALESVFHEIEMFDRALCWYEQPPMDLNVKGQEDDNPERPA